MSRIRINSIKRDGDFHNAGRRDSEIGLMTVVEIRNARQGPIAMDLARNGAGKDSRIHVTCVCARLLVIGMLGPRFAHLKP
jgi:hypothetical protein